MHQNRISVVLIIRHIKAKAQMTFTQVSSLETTAHPESKTDSSVAYKAYQFQNQYLQSAAYRIPEHEENHGR